MEHAYSWLATADGPGRRAAGEGIASAIDESTAQYRRGVVAAVKPIVIWISRIRRLITRRRMLLLALLVLAVSFAGGLALHLMERDVNPKATNLGVTFLWAITMVAAAGGSDIGGPITTPGFVLRVIMRLMGTGFIGLFTAAIATIFIDGLLREGKGLKPVRQKSHLLILGYNDKLAVIVQEVRRETDAPIVLVADLTEKPLEAEAFYFVRGKPYESEALVRANLQAADAAIVLADTAEGPASDARTVLAALAVESIHPEIYTCVEVMSARSIEHLKRAGVDEILPTNSLVGNLLARASHHRGVIAAVTDLASAEAGADISVMPVPDWLIGETFGAALARVYANRQAVLLGLRRNGQVKLSPGPEEKVEPGDELVVVAREGLKPL